MCVNHYIFIPATSQLQALLVWCSTMARYSIRQHIFHVSNEVRHKIYRKQFTLRGIYRFKSRILSYKSQKANFNVYNKIFISVKCAWMPITAFSSYCMNRYVKCSCLKHFLGTEVLPIGPHCSMIIWENPTHHSVLLYEKEVIRLQTKEQTALYMGLLDFL